MHLLGEIIKNASVFDLEKFSFRFLFEPLGIDTSAWPIQYPNGVYDGNSLVLQHRGSMTGLKE